MPLRQQNNTSDTFYMSNMNVGISLRWMSAATITLWHHFHSTSDPNSKIWGQLCWYDDKDAPIVCPWDSIQMAQTLRTCLIWMWEAVWGGYQPQPWRNGNISTPQVATGPPLLGGWSSASWFWEHMERRGTSPSSGAQQQTYQHTSWPFLTLTARIFYTLTSIMISPLMMHMLPFRTVWTVGETF